MEEAKRRRQVTYSRKHRAGVARRLEQIELTVKDLKAMLAAMARKQPDQRRQQEEQRGC